jgi:quercetin dioxygenase-like cupin family protein
MSDGEKTSHLFQDVDEGAASDLPFEPMWVKSAELPSFSPLPGASIRSVAGEKLMAAWITIEPNVDYPYHQHPHEQLGIMFQGAMELSMNGESRLLRPGDVYLIPPNLPHKARTYEDGCVVVDIFSPPRADYLKTNN